MKVLAVFAAVIAVAFGLSPISTWTLGELSDAIQDPSTNPALLPYLENALDELMANLHGGVQQAAITVSLPMESSWTLNELSNAIENPSTSPALLPFYEAALNQMVHALMTGQAMETINVAIPAMNVQMWTLNELSDAIQNPATDPATLVYLEHALNEIMASLFTETPLAAIGVVSPPGVVIAAPTPIPVEVPEHPIAVIPAPIDPEIVIVDPMPVVVPEPVAPVPEPVAPISSPLVKIIVNVNQL